MAQQHTFDFEKVGEVSVDSGLMMFADPCYTIGNSQEWYDGLNKILWPANFKGPCIPQLGPTSIDNDTCMVLPTIYGDGVYGVYAATKRGRLMGYFIDFEGFLLPEEDEGEDYE